MELSIGLSDEARRALLAAEDTARQDGSHQITPHHIALGILADNTSLAATVLESMGIDVLDLAETLRTTSPAGPGDCDQPDELRLSDPARRSLQIAQVEARRTTVAAARGEANKPTLSTGHLLLGLISPTSSADVKALRSHGVFYGEVVEILRRLG